MNDIKIPEHAWTALEKLHAKHQNDGFQKYFLVFHDFLESFGLGEYFWAYERKIFRRRVLSFYRAASAIWHADFRMNQLREASFDIWIYRLGDPLACGDMHGALDGLALPPSHPFWLRYAPPTLPNCSCYILGARSIRGIGRLGGDPEKKLPDWWNTNEPQTGLPMHTESPFAVTPRPDIRALFLWASAL